jgi:hypothetical protein
VDTPARSWDDKAAVMVFGPHVPVSWWTLAGTFNYSIFRNCDAERTP